jgi:transcriptional regulator with XRE-family HTH domain
MGLRASKSIPTLGEFLREQRQREGLSLRAAASKLNVHFTYVGDVERGSRAPSKALLQKLAGLYAVDIKDLQKLDERIPLEELRRAVKECPEIGLELKRLLANSDAGKLRLEKVAKALSTVR